MVTKSYEAAVDDENCLLLAFTLHPPYLNRFALRYFTSDKEGCAWIQVKLFVSLVLPFSGFGGLGVACWPLVPKFAGSNPAEAVGFLGRKILSTRSFGGEVKPSVSCRRFAACKRSLNLRGSRNFRQNYRTISHPQFHLSLLGSLASLRTYRHLAAKVGTSKGGGKQWQTTPKYLPRMQCARAIPVTWLSSGSCQLGL